MPPECEEIEDHGVPEKISCIDGAMKEYLRFQAFPTLCGANIYPRSSFASAFFFLLAITSRRSSYSEDFNLHSLLSN